MDRFLLKTKSNTFNKYIDSTVEESNRTHLTGKKFLALLVKKYTLRHLVVLSACFEN